MPKPAGAETRVSRPCTPVGEPVHQARAGHHPGARVGDVELGRDQGACHESSFHQSTAARSRRQPTVRPGVLESLVPRACEPTTRTGALPPAHARVTSSVRTSCRRSTGSDRRPASGQERRSGPRPRAIASSARGRHHHRAGRVERETTMAATKTTASKDRQRRRVQRGGACGDEGARRRAARRGQEGRQEGRRPGGPARGHRQDGAPTTGRWPSGCTWPSRPTPPSSSRRPGTACRRGPTPRARSSCSSRTRASSSTGSRPWASRTPRTSTTATSGRRRTRC